MQRKKLFLDYKYLLISLLFFAGQSSLFAQIPAAPTVTVQWNDGGTLKPAPRCGNGQVIATAAGAPTGGVYKWYSTAEGGNSLVTTTGITVATNSLTVNQVRFNVTYYVSVFANNAESPRVPVIFTVTPQARILSGTRTGFCGNLTVPLVAEADPTAVSYQWSYFGVNSEGDADWIVAGTGTTITASSTATYRLIVTNNSGCATQNVVEVAANYTPNALILDGATEGTGTQRIDRYCAGSNNTLNAQVDLGSTYTWIYSATNSSDINTFTTEGTGLALSPANKEGFYKVRVNKNGCFQDSEPVQVIKSDIPTATITVNGTTAFCQGETRTLTAVTDLGDTYIWEYAAFATGTFTTASGVNNASTYLATQAGSYRVTISKGVGSQCVKTSDPVSLTIIDEPTVDKVGAKVTICKGEKATLTAKDQEPTYTTPITYQWYYSATPFSDLAPVNLGTTLAGATAKTYTQADQPGFYRVQVTPATCPAGGTYSAPIRTEVVEAKVSNGSSFEICDGTSVVLQGLSVNDATYLWKYSLTATGTFAAATGTNNQNNYTAFTTGFYRLELSHPSCPMQTVDVQVKQKEATVLNGNPTSFCVSDGTGVVLKAETGGTGYLWSYSGNKNGPFSPATGTNNTENYTATASGWYKIQLTKDACPLVNTVEVKESTEPPPVSIVESPKTSFCQNAAGSAFVELNATPKGLNIYRWSQSATETGTYTPIPSTNNSEYAASGTGYYKVEVFNEKDGCVKISPAVFVEAITTIDKATILGEPTVFMCPDGNVSLTASPANPAYTYKWFKTPFPLTGASVFTEIVGFTSASYTTNQINTAFKVEISSATCGSKLSAATSVIKDLAFTSATVIGADQYCKGNSIVLKTNITDGTTYSWKKVGTPDTQVGTAQELTVKEAGTYYVEINRLGCLLKSGNHVVIEKDAVDKPAIIPSPKGGICEGGSTVLTSSLTGTGITYKWKYSSNTSGLKDEATIKALPTIGTNSTVTASQLGFYVLEVSQTDCGTSLSDPIRMDQLAAPKPSINEGSRVTLCKSTDPSIEISTNLLGYDKYVWKKATSATGTYTDIPSTNSESYNATQGGFYKVEVTDPTTKCKINSDPVEVVEITQLEKPIVSYAPSANLCSNNQLTINSNSVSTGYTYLWEFSATNTTFTAATGTNNQTTYTATAKGWYTIKISHPECGSATSNPIEIKDPIVPTPVPSLNTLETDFCDSYNLETPSATGRTYQWQFTTTSGGAYTNISGATGNTYLADQAGFFRVAVSEKGCTEISAAAKLTKAGTIPKPIIEQGVAINLCGDNKIPLSVVEENPMHEYQWTYSADGVAAYADIAGAKGTTYQADKVGYFRVRVLSTSPLCGENTSNAIKINSPKTSKPVSIEQGTSITMCDKGDNILEALPLDAQNYIWEYSADNGATFTTIFVGDTYSKITITNAGQYKVTVINNFCPVTSAVSTVTKSGVMPESFIKETSPLELCSGGTVKMTSKTQSSGFTYEWQYADNTTKVAANNFTIVGTNSFEYNANALGFYRLKITSSCGTSTSPIVKVYPSSNTFFVSVPLTASFCDGQDVEITASLLGADRYQWALNGTIIPKTNSETYSASAAGNYSVLVTQNGCVVSSNVVAVTKGTTPNKPVIKNAPATPLCNNGEIELSFTGGSSFYTYKWQFSDNGTAYADATGTNNGDKYMTKTEGFYRVLVNGGACGNTQSDPIKISPPKPDSRPVVIEQGTEITMCDKALNTKLSALPLDAENYIWEYSTDGTAFTVVTSGVNRQSIDVSAAGKYRVTVQNKSCSVTSAVSTLTKTNTTPTPEIANTNPVEMCSGGTVKLTSKTQSDSYTYQWQYADNTTKVANNTFTNVGTNSPEFNAGALGFYRLQITSPCGTSNSPIIKVNPNTNTFVVTIPNSATFCAGQDVEITASILGADRYQWTLNGTVIPKTNSETFAANSAGTYGVLVTQNGCVVASNNMVVTIGTAPNKPVIKNSPSTPLCGNNEVELSFTGGSSYYTYKWQYSATGTGYADAAGTNTSDKYTAKAKGFYKVLVNGGTCGNTETDPIQITDPQALATPSIRQTSPVGLCKGGDILLDITDTYDKYEWYFAPKATPTVFALQASSSLASGKQYYANKIGFYKIRVFKGSCSVESASVEVIETTSMPKPVIAGSSIINICANGKAKMETITQSNFYSYQWKRSSTSAGTYTDVAGATNAIFEATQEGFYVVEIKSPTCTGTGVSDYIKVNPYVVSAKPAIEQPDPTEFCKDIVLSVATGTAFKWYFSDTKTGTYTLIAGATSATYSANKKGFYKVGVTENGCENTTDPIELKEISTMPKPFFANGSTASVCSSGKLALRILNYSNSHQYQWEYAETAAQVASNTYTELAGAKGQIYETDKGGFYRVKVSSTVCGNSISDPIEVEVGKSLDKAEIAQGAKTTFCPNGDVILNATPGAKYKYVWEMSPLDKDTFEKIVGAVDSNYVAKKEGKYRVKITSAGCEATSGVTVVTQSSTMEKPEIKQGKKLVFCNLGTTIEVKTQGSSFNYTWLYAPKTGNFTNVGNGASIFASAAGFYRIQVEAEGCGLSISESIEMIKSDEPPVAKIEQGKSTTFCRNSFAVLAATPQTADVETTTGFIFRWLYSKDGKENYQTVGYLNTHQTNVEGFYQLTVARDGCFAVSEPIELRQTDGMPPATIDKGTKVSFCEGGNVDLKVTSKGLDYKYAWEFSETQNGTFNLVSPNKEILNVNKQGYYRLTVSKEGCGQSSTIIEVFPTNNRPEASILQGATTFFCGEGNVLLEAFRNTGYTYSWSYSTERNGQYQARGTDSVFVARTPGFYRLTVSNNGCSVISTPTEVQRLEQMPPSEFLGATIGFCRGESAKLQSKIKSGSITYNWFFSPNGQTFEAIGGSTPELNVNKGGFYRFEMSQSSCGTSRSATVQLVEVDPALFPKPLTLTNAFTSVCLGENAELRAANVPGASTYLWSGPDGFLAKTQNATVTKTTTRSAGIYTLTANLTGCEQIAKVDLRVNPLPNYTLNVVDKICEGTQNGLIEATTTASGLQYSFNGGAFGTQNKFDQLRSGTYRLIVRTADGCQTTNDIVIREVTETMTVKASSASEWIYKNDEMQLNASGGTTYSWSPSTGLSATNIANPIASPRETTEYTVKVSSKEGCGVAKVKVEVRINYELTINNVLTPNGDGSNDVWRIKNIDNHATAEIKVFDRWGIEVFSKKGNYNSDWEGTDNSGGKLPTGAYYYIISNLSGDIAPKTGAITIFR